MAENIEHRNFFVLVAMILIVFQKNSFSSISLLFVQFTKPVQEGREKGGDNWSEWASSSSEQEMTGRTYEIYLPGGSSLQAGAGRQVEGG